MTLWKEERCSSQPEEVQVIATGLLMERRDIRQVNHEATDMEPAYTDWVCMSREISESEYQMLKSIEAIDTQDAIDAYTEQLLEEGVI